MKKTATYHPSSRASNFTLLWTPKKTNILQDIWLFCICHKNTNRRVSFLMLQVDWQGKPRSLEEHKGGTTCGSNEFEDKKKTSYELKTINKTILRSKDRSHLNSSTLGTQNSFLNLGNVKDHATMTDPSWAIKRIGVHSGWATSNLYRNQTSK